MDLSGFENLPYVPRKLICECSKSIDLFLFAYKHSEIQNSIISIGRPVDTYQLKFLISKISLLLTFENGEKIELNYVANPLLAVRINGKWEKTNAVYGGYNYHVDNMNSLDQLLQQHLQILRNLFPGPISEVSMDLGRFQNFTNHLFPSGTTLNCEKLIITGIPTSSDDLNNVLKRVRASGKVDISSFSNDVNVDSLATCSDCLYIRPRNTETPLEWITVSKLLTSNSKYIELEGTTFNGPQINQLLRSWMSAEFSDELGNLEYLSLGCVRNVKKSEILRGIDAKGWDKTKRSGTYRCPLNRFVDTRRGLDIEREDGLLATVILPKNRKNPDFQLIIWRQRFSEELSSIPRLRERIDSLNEKALKFEEKEHHHRMRALEKMKEIEELQRQAHEMHRVASYFANKRNKVREEIWKDEMFIRDLEATNK